MSKFIRQFHRWTSIVFALVVAAIFVMLGLGQQPAEWIYYTPLLYMFFLPDVRRRSPSTPSS